MSSIDLYKFLPVEYLQHAALIHLHDTVLAEEQQQLAGKPNASHLH